MKKVLVLILSAFLVLGVFTPVLAQEEEMTAEEVNSFELFWPVVAGRTKGDALYPLKTFKENVRGLLIFGKAQKAEYLVFLTTKRVVEVEKLLNEGQQDRAQKTLAKAISQVEMAKINAQSADSLSDVADEMNNRLDNLEKFLPWLSSKHEGASGQIQNLLNQVRDLNQNI